MQILLKFGWSIAVPIPCSKVINNELFFIECVLPSDWVRDERMRLRNFKANWIQLAQFLIPGRHSYEEWLRPGE